MIGVVAIGCAAGCSSGASPRAQHPRPVTPAATTSGASAVSHHANAPRSGGSLFHPAGASFISPTTGWVLGSVGCESCAAIWRTTDQGRSWTALASPGDQLGYAHPSATKVDDIYFANARDGYLYGPGLEVTRDGGKTWKRESVPAVTALAGGAGRVYALLRPHDRPEELVVNRPGSTSWSRVVLPPLTGSLKLAVDGPTVALLKPGTDVAVPDPSDRRGKLLVSTDAGRKWQQRPVPCKAAVDGGAAVISLALGHSNAVLLDCFSNQQSSQEQQTQHHLFGSADGGQHWVRLADPTRTGAPVLLADNGAGHAFLTTEGVTDMLDGSLDHAQHWHRILGSGGSFYGWNDLTFITTEDGYVVGPTHYAPENLYFTTNGGRHWRKIKFTVPRPKSTGSNRSAALPSCRVSQLSAVAQLAPVGAGSDEYRVTISDHGRACRFRGRPTNIHGVSLTGQRVDVHLTGLPESEEHAMLTGKPANLDRDHRADLVLVTGTACDKPATRFRTLLVAVDQGRLRVRYAGGPEPVDLALGMDLQCGVSISPFEASFPRR